MDASARRDLDEGATPDKVYAWDSPEAVTQRWFSVLQEVKYQAQRFLLLTDSTDASSSTRW
jgi:hypothetical protein